MSSLEDVLRSSQPNLVHLVEIKAYQGDSGEFALIGFCEPLGYAPHGLSLPLTDYAAAIATDIELNYSDRGVVFAPDDADRPNADYEGRAIMPLDFEVMLPLRQSSRAAVEFGEVVLDNADGDLTGLVKTLAVEGRPLRVLVGVHGAPYSEYMPLISALSLGWQAGQKVRIDLRGGEWDLDIPLVGEQHRYTGAGGAGGDPQLENLSMPVCFGECKNVAPICVNKAKEIYQVHFRSIESIDAVRDETVALTPNGNDYADYAALEAATVASGYYATCLAEGMIRLGGAAAGQITADVKGDNVGGYIDTTGEIAVRMMTVLGSVLEDSIDVPSWEALPDGPIGLFVAGGAETSLSAELNRLTDGVGGYWYRNEHGILVAGYLRDPADVESTFALDDDDGITVEPLGRQERVWRVQVRYARNWTKQRQAPYDTEGPTAVWANPNILIRSPGAADEGVIESLFVNKADAQEVAERHGALFGHERNSYAIEANGNGYLIKPGSYGRLTYSRDGLDDGLSGICIGRRIQAGRTELYFWG